MWGVASAVLAWRFLPYLTLSPLYVVLVACLSFFLLAGVFNVSVNVVSHFLKDNTRVGEGPGTPAVAVLYCTYNDFDRGAASSALRLTYPHLSVWILDDSMDPGSRRDVDAFAEEASEHGRPVRIVRRSDRKGFKAGAINHVLRLLPPEVRYVAIVDADEVLAPDFVEGCLRHFTRADVGFVQANHRCTNGSASWFTRYMGVGVDLHWRHYQRYRNRYGTVNMLGHGALVRRDVLERTGGFPEVACEDIAFTVAARIAGYRGAFAPDIVCGESFPEDFAAMRRRHLRWSWATVEFLRRFALPLGRSRARWYEKMDLLLPSVSLPGVFVLLAFLAIVHGLQWAGWGLPVFDDPVVMGLGLFASFAPLTMFVDLWRRPVFALKAVVLNTVAYLGLVPVSVHGLLLGVARPAEFLVTPKGARGPLCVCKAAFDTRLEIAFGMTLLGLGVATLGPWGLVSPIAVVALLAPLLMVVSRRSLPAT
ncbi:MAG: hypothetical protein A3K68_06200 [Euryarchaeota archaeon RBG_16_68_13]|nr:MAG: hypothetical protein A3K68_06200 [Euryarchaeota archaeon RBG_16_68_13]